jgi:hypothetical protein
MSVADNDDLKHRPLISLKDGKILHDGKPCRACFCRRLLFIGCSNVTPEAARFIMAEYDRQFPKGKV